MKTLKPCLLSTSICVALMLGPGIAYAQSQPAEKAGTASTTSTANADCSKQQSGNSCVQKLQTITVTARGVAEPLQKTPLPITVVTQKVIAQKGITNVNGIAAMTPGFSFQSPFGRNLSRPVIRGMSNILGSPNASFFINGIYVQGDVSEYGLQNIKQVAVIRGPQSAEFGRGTFSGAINFITMKPGANPGGTITLGIGNYGQKKEGFFYSGNADNGKFGYDISLFHTHNGGTFYNEASGEKDLGGRDSKSYMLALYWSPTPSLEFTFRSMYQKNKDQMWPIKRMGADNLNCYLPEYTGRKLYGLYPILKSRRTGSFCGDVSAPQHYAMNTDVYRKAGYFPGTKHKYWRNSLRIKYYFANGWQLTSTSAYDRTKTYTGADQDYSAARGYGGAFESIVGAASRDISENLRLASDQTRALSGLIGLYYYKQTAEPGYHGSLAGFFPPTTMTVHTIPTNPDSHVIAKAVYGMLKWDIDRHWTAALEARYARDEISNAGVDIRTLGTHTYRLPYSLSKTFTNFTPRVSLTYHFDKPINLYVLASKGTKPGGFNLDVYRADFTKAGREKLISRGYGSYDQQIDWNYEMGLKSELFNHHLRLNADVYQINWTNQALTKGVPVVRKNGTLFDTSYIANVGKSRIRGFELMSRWVFNSGWRVRLTYSYTDAEIEKFFSQDHADTFCTVPVPTINMPCASSAGNRLPLVPKQMASLGFLYSGHFSNNWGYDFSFDTHYHGEEFGNVGNLLIIPASLRSNIRFSVTPNKHVQVSFYVDNAFADHTPSGGMGYIDPTRFVAIPKVPPLTGYQVTNLGDYTVSPSLPRMYGVELSLRF